MESIRILIKKYKEGKLHEIWDEFKWMFSYAKNYKKEIVFYTLLGVFSTIMTLVSSVASKELIDIVTGYKIEKAGLMAFLMISMSLFSLFFNQLMSRITMKINLRIQNDIQADIFEKIIKVNWLDLSKYHSGDLLNRFSSDVSTVSQSAIGWVPNLIISLFNFIATLLLILYYDSTMMILSLINAPIMLIASRYMMSRMRKFDKKVKEMNSKVMAFQSETFANVDSIKSFNLSCMFTNKLKEYQNEYKEVNLEYNMFSIKSNVVLSLIGMFVNFSFYGWAVYRLWTRQITYGEMTLFLQQSTRLASAFKSLVAIIPSTISSTISASRLMEIVHLPAEEEDDKTLEDLVNMQDQGFSLTLKDVTFAYVEDKNVLVKSSMYAKPGEIVALVGPSGEGKTTLIRMFLGLIHPTSGEAKMVNEKEEEIKLGITTRNMFAYVPQGNTIFSGSIADNLRLGKEDASEEEIIEALKLACAYEFVEKMENGIHTQIGARGKGLSEGQAQRISIARAILKDAPILLLDEATSALDVVTERRVLNNIILQRPNKTCIVTTHRPSVLHMCQRVYRVIDTKLTQLSDEEASQMAIDY